MMHTIASTIINAEPFVELLFYIACFSALILCILQLEHLFHRIRTHTREHLKIKRDYARAARQDAARKEILE